MLNGGDPSYLALKAKAPYGQFPVLESEDGKMLAQSGAIERFLVRIGHVSCERGITLL